MPAFDIDSQSPGGSFEPRPSESWSVPVGAIAGIRLYLSYSVFVTLAVLAGIVALVQGREGNGDLPWIALTAVIIWCVGWILQFVVQLGLHFGTAAKSDAITIGLLGIETPNPLYRRHPWSAVSHLMAACFSLTGLVLLGAICLVVHLLVNQANYADGSVWLDALATPGLGMDTAANGYLTATWLFWIQAACQAYPLQKNLGRGAIASTIVLFTTDADDESQTRLFRRVLQMIAVITVVIALATMIAGSEAYLPRWQIMVLLAVYLWMSTNKQDLRDWITSVHLAGSDPANAHFETKHSADRHPHPSTSATSTKTAAPAPWISEMIDSVRMRQKRKRARAVMKREREEAIDADRLDQVLKMVSERGTDGLNASDRALLQRVSENLRRHRQSRPDHDEV